MNITKTKMEDKVISTWLKYKRSGICIQDPSQFDHFVFYLIQKYIKK